MGNEPAEAPEANVGFIKLLAISMALGLLPFILLNSHSRQFFSPDVYKMLVLWGIPAIIAAGGFVLFPRLPCSIAGHGLSKKRRWVIPLCFAAFIIDYHFLPIGRMSAAVDAETFLQMTFSRFVWTFWAFPLCLLAGVFAFERTLRAGLCSAWSARIPVAWALAVSCVIGTLLSFGSYRFGLGSREFPHSVAAMIVVISRELLFGLIFLAGRSVWPGGIYRGLMYYMEAFILQDIGDTASEEFVSSQSSYYVLRAATAILATAAFAFGYWRRGRNQRRHGETFKSTEAQTP